jgi:dsRNA-specific ribonuclease
LTFYLLFYKIVLNKYFIKLNLKTINKTINKSKMDNTDEIYHGNRGEEFHNYIREMLSKGKIKDKYINSILTPDNIKILDMAFTHESANPYRNYQFLENLGDSSANKAIVWYFARRFPQINCPEGVNILARLKIKYGAKKSFAIFGNKLGFWSYVSASMTVRNSRYSKTLDDVFEAFFAAVEKIVDETFMIGVGYSVVYDIISNFMNSVDVSLEYKDLFDAKSRLNETISWYLKENKEKPWYKRYKQTTSEYIKYNGEKDQQNKFISRVTIQNLEIQGNFVRHPIIIGEGTNFVKVEAEINASEIALSWLEKKGVSKPIPEFYKNYCQFNESDF